MKMDNFYNRMKIMCYVKLQWFLIYDGYCSEFLSQGTSITEDGEEMMKIKVGSTRHSSLAKCKRTEKVKSDVDKKTTIEFFL